MLRKKAIPLLSVRKRMQEVTKHFPREVSYGDLTDPADYSNNCVFVIDIDPDQFGVVLEDCRSGEKYTLTSEESRLLGASLVRAGVNIDKL